MKIEKKKLYEKWAFETDIECQQPMFSGTFHYDMGGSTYAGDLTASTMPLCKRKVMITAKISKDNISFRNHQGQKNFQFTHSNRTLTEAIVNLMKEALELKQ